MMNLQADIHGVLALFPASVLLKISLRLVRGSLLRLRADYGLSFQLFLLHLMKKVKLMEPMFILTMCKVEIWVQRLAGTHMTL